MQHGAYVLPIPGPWLSLFNVAASVADTCIYVYRYIIYLSLIDGVRYWLLDAANYYFDHALRLGQADYFPNDEDMIMTRIRTTGIDTTEFSEPPYMFSVVDVGGQRNERRKWIHCFDNVKVQIVSACCCCCCCL